MKQIVRIAVFVTILSGCKKAPFVINAANTIPLHGCIQQTGKSGFFNLCFDSVLEDSRCPRHVECIWQGMALAKFTLTAGLVRWSFVLTARQAIGGYKADTTIEGYTIRFIDLYPYPGDQPGPQKAQVLVTH